MKTLMPDADAMNGVLPVDGQGDDNLVDTEEGTLVRFDNAPELLENMEGEFVQPLSEDGSNKFLNRNHGRRTKKDTFKGSHRDDHSPTHNCRHSSKIRHNENLMDVLDPPESRLEEKIEAHQCTRSPRQKPDLPKKTNLESNEADGCRSPMMNPPLKSEKAKIWSEEDCSGPR